jgi:carboxyl-terminal processing protease
MGSAGRPGDTAVHQFAHPLAAWFSRSLEWSAIRVFIGLQRGFDVRHNKPTHRVRRSLGVLALVLVSLIGGVLVDRVFLAGVVPSALVPANAVEDFQLMALVWNLIEARYADPQAIDPEKMTYGAIGGMVDALGDTGHSSFLTPQMVALSDDVSTGNFAGIGAEIGTRKGEIVIVSPIDNTPASRAGLRPGDAILQVNGVTVVSLSLAEVVARIRGPVGTKVTLQILPSKGDKPHDVTLVRAEIPIDTVHWLMVPGTHDADVRISSFSKGTTGALAEALRAAGQGGATGVILDLRDNPGGLLEEAVGVTSLFVPEGDALKERDRSGKVTPVPVEPDQEVWSGPVAVLVNGGTASASEIVAGALRDQRQAPLIGEKTFGTGTVLQQFPLPDGSAVLLAVGEWLTPAGESFWHKGLDPTITVALGDDTLPLRPSAMKHLTPEEVSKSHDSQLLAAIKWLGEQAPQHEVQQGDRNR